MSDEGEGGGSEGSTGDEEMLDYDDLVEGTQSVVSQVSRAGGGRGGGAWVLSAVVDVGGWEGRTWQRRSRRHCRTNRHSRRRAWTYTSAPPCRSDSSHVHLPVPWNPVVADRSCGS